MTKSESSRLLWPTVAAIAMITLVQACSISYVPTEFDFDKPAVPTIDVKGSVTFTNAQTSTDRVTVSSYGGMTAESDYHAITEVMVKDGFRLLRENQRSLGEGTPKTIALKVTALQSRYIGDDHGKARRFDRA